MNGATGPCSDVTVITSGHDVADAPLHRIVAALVRAGQAVEVLRVGSRDDGPVGALVRTTVRGSLARRAFPAMTMPWRARGAVIVCLDPDAAVGCAPVRSLRRRKLVVDVHEDYGALLDNRAWATGLRGWLARRLLTLATTVAATADLTVVADEHLPPPAQSCRRRLMVRNLPDLGLMGSSPGYAGKDASPRAVYIGDVRRSRGLESMVEAVAAARAGALTSSGRSARRTRRGYRGASSGRTPPAGCGSMGGCHRRPRGESRAAPPSVSR